jgi:hypothetical protein
VLPRGFGVCDVKDTLTCPLLLVCFTAVLHTVQDKLNNPSPEDPFEPEIAAVRTSLATSRSLLLISFWGNSISICGLSWRPDHLTIYGKRLMSARLTVVEGE